MSYCLHRHSLVVDDENVTLLQSRYLGEEGDACILSGQYILLYLSLFSFVHFSVTINKNWSSRFEGAVCIGCPIDCISMSNSLSNSMLGRSAYALMFARWCNFVHPKGLSSPYLFRRASTYVYMLHVFYRWLVDPLLVMFVQRFVRQFKDVLELHPNIDLARVVAHIRLSILVYLDFMSFSRGLHILSLFHHECQ